MKDNSTESAFWTLLRRALWQTDEPLPSLSAPQWHELVRMALSSGTAGLLAEGIEGLPSGQRPPADVLQELVVQRSQLIRRHQHHNAVIAHLHALFAELGVESWLLKGQGNALQYAVPTCRSSHDIDIYVGPAHLDPLLLSLQHQGITCEEEIDDNGHHATFYYERVRIELHRHPTIMDTPRADRAFQRWWEEGCKRPERVSIGGAQVQMAAPTQNAFFIFYHAYHHLYSMDPHLGAFCDVARFLFTHQQSIDRQDFEAQLCQQRLMAPWQAIASMMHHSLGADPATLPAYRPTARPGRAERAILRRLRRKCLYPRQPLFARPQGRLFGKLYSLALHIGVFFSSFALFPLLATRTLLHRIVAGVGLFFSKKNRSGTAEHYLNRTQSTPQP